MIAMREQPEPTVHCAGCGAVVGESPELASDKRQPCGKCGSLARNFGMTFEAEVEMRGDLKLEHRRGNSAKPNRVVRIIKTGAEFFRKRGVWYQRYRDIDRENDLYVEEIIDEHGQKTRVEEPLSKHQGHGSAKGKP